MGAAYSTVPPGPVRATLLAPVIAADVPDLELMELARAEYEQLSYQQARVWAVLSEAANRAPMNLPAASAWTPDQVSRFAADEVRAELRLTGPAARLELDRADAVMALPAVAAALSAGVIDRNKAIAFANGCYDLSPEHQQTVIERVLPEAAALTLPTLRNHIDRLVIALDPD